jgi:UDP-N-acetylmuramoyl-tripeptide--D-alanyl-D-alanine ligase
VSNLRLDQLARPRFHLTSPWGEVDVELGVSGRHMASNAAAALTVAGVAGVDLADAAKALRDATLSPHRMHIDRLASGAILIDDSYNANPTSMRAAIDALTEMPAVRRVAVLGLMAELADAGDEHLAIAAYARARDVELIAYETALYGIAPCADPVAELGALGAGDAVLVKGSRVAALDRVAAALRAA